MNKTFSRIKTQSLNRLDLSKKGSVDEHIEHVVSLLNSCEQFFTTSSCSGRIILIDKGIYEKQRDESVKGDLNFPSPAEAVNTMRLNISSTLLSGSELVDKLCRHCGREDKEDQMCVRQQCNALKTKFRSHVTDASGGTT